VGREKTSKKRLKGKKTHWGVLSCKGGVRWLNINPRRRRAIAVRGRNSKSYVKAREDPLQRKLRLQKKREEGAGDKGLLKKGVKTRADS